MKIVTTTFITILTIFLHQFSPFVGKAFIDDGNDGTQEDEVAGEGDLMQSIDCIIRGVVVNRDLILKAFSFLKPRELLAVSEVNKALRHVIASDYKLILDIGLTNGGRSKKSLENLLRLIRLQAIYIPTPLRLLRIINGVRCEFCNNGYTHYLRPNAGVMACWDCLCKRQPNEFGATGEQFNSLSARWHKVLYLYGKGPFMKQFYYAHRFIIYEILSHQRVIGDCTGTRYLRKVGEEWIPTTTWTSNETKKSRDAHEILWRKPRRDACGDLVGPIVCKSNISDLVTFVLKEEEIGILYRCVTQAIGNWIQDKIKDCPRPGDYTLISKLYDHAWAAARRKELLRMG